MNTIQLIHELNNQIDELSQIGSRLASENGLVSSLDKELLKHKCIALYESVLKLTLQTGNPDATEVIDHAAPVIEPKPPVSMEEFEVKEAVLISTEIMPAVEKEAKMETHILSPQPTPEADLFTETTSTKKDVFIHIPHTEVRLHEKISGAKQHDLKERFSESKVESLKAAITLNKKIAFVNELFRENTVDYAKAIDKLNASADLNEAMLYFSDLKQQYAWNKDNEYMLELEQLIQKRFR
jgi:hypothetical protein